MCRSLLMAACVMLTLWLEDGSTRRSLGEPPVHAKTGADSAGGPLVLVGVAKIDITPSYPVRLTGYGSRQKESEGVAQKIWAKALVIGGELARKGPARKRPAPTTKGRHCCSPPTIAGFRRRWSTKSRGDWPTRRA